MNSKRVRESAGVGRAASRGVAPASTSADGDSGADRDTVELSGEDLSRLRAFDENAVDRDTVEITAPEAARLAQGLPPCEERATAFRSGEIPVSPTRLLVDDDESEAVDRAAILTIPAPPSFDDVE